MQDAAGSSEQEWYAELEHTVRLEMLAAAFLAGGNAELEDEAWAGARSLLDEPTLSALPMAEFILLSDFIEAGWEFCLGDLIRSLQQGVTLRQHVTRLVARRLRGVVNHFDLSAAEILACVESEPAQQRLGEARPPAPSQPQG